MALRCFVAILVLIAVAAAVKVEVNNSSTFQLDSKNVTQYGVSRDDSDSESDDLLEDVRSREERSPDPELMRDNDRWGRRDNDDDDERGSRHSRRSRRGDYDRDNDDDDDDNNSRRRRRRRRKDDDDDDDEGRTPEFKHCGGDSIRLHVHKFPNPLLLKEGEKLNMAFTAVVTETLPEPIYARISIRKKVLGLWNRIPCVGRVGSCEYEVTCEKIQKQYGGRMNQPCPPPVGKTQREFTFTMPKIPRIVRNFASGTYKIQAQLFTKKKKRGELLACSETQVRVQT